MHMKGDTLISTHTYNLYMQTPLVTLHHEMSPNEPDGHCHVFIFSESKFYAIYNG